MTPGARRGRLTPPRNARGTSNATGDLRRFDAGPRLRKKSGVKQRFLIGAGLFVAGLVLPAIAVAAFGVPWGFGDRAAVLLSSVGTVEVRLSKHPAGLSRGKPETTARPTDDFDFYTGDEVRVGSLSELRLKTATGVVTLGDGASLKFFDEGIEFRRGMAWVETTGTTVVTVPDRAVMVELKPGRHLLSADGRGQFYVTVLDGVGRVSAEGGAWKAGQSGNTLTLEGSGDPEWKPTNVDTNCAASCKIRGMQALMKGRTKVGSQVFINGALIYPDTEGRFEVALPEGKDATEGTLFVRGPAGGVCRAQITCRVK